MKKGTIKLLLISIFILIILIIFVKSFSSLSSSNVKVNDRELDINVQLNRKIEQVNNINNSFKNLINDEELFDSLEKLNTEFKSSMSKEIKDKEKANNDVTNELNLLFDKTTEEILKDENIVKLIEELLKTEKRLITAKNNYNEAVDSYNSNVKNFPSSIIASFRGFKSKNSFEIVKLKDILEKEE